MYAANQFKLGFFSPNCSGGMAVTKVPERWVNSWDNNLKLAQLADEAGIDFLLPIARWIGYGGATDFHGSVLETITWAAGLLASTKDISVFATIHTGFNHPVAVAKQIATMDQIGHGRAGLNIVCGWNKPEYDAFGVALPKDHVTRYRYGQEWFDIIRKLWAEEAPFDWKGEFFNLEKVYGNPKPLRGNVPIINAAGSEEGRKFATRNANFLFTPAIDLEVSKAEIISLRDQAKALGRAVEMLTFTYAVCRPTRKEAEDYHQYYSQDNADWVAVDRIIELMFEHAQSFPVTMLKLLRDRFSAGHGGYPLVGTPDDVADGIERLALTGFGGATLAFVDYVKEFPYFRDEVLPRLERKGLRQKSKAKAA
jgi:alkanesulfonate monooxygenase SsuD/methylene tetrahydromethanopterin reductase-like flavin-dependent oxidoreductase (luciferase family)